MSSIAEVDTNLRALEEPLDHAIARRRAGDSGTGPRHGMAERQLAAGASVSNRVIAPSASYVQDISAFPARMTCKASAAVSAARSWSRNPGRRNSRLRRARTRKMRLLIAATDEEEQDRSARLAALRTARRRPSGRRP